jgi:cytochrome c oxidase subunit 2
MEIVYRKGINIFFNHLKNDAAQPRDLYLQDSASSNYDSIIDLHDDICFWLILISGAVFTMGFILIYNYRNNIISNKDLTHGTVIEMVWTITPALVLVAVGVPSFRVLYLSDEILSPNLTVKAIGHQWYWSYGLDDLVDNLAFDSYMVANDDLETGQLRLLDVDNSLALPVGTIIRMLTVSTDVIHSFAVPSLGIKVDALPGRLNQTTVLINRLGTFYGQCSELCGAYHAFMPISIDAVTPGQFIAWAKSLI